MFNVVVGPAGGGQAILIRSAEPMDGWDADLSGPAKLARGFAITGAENGIDLTKNCLYFITDPNYRPKINRTKRIGIDYAGHWKSRHLRFIDVGNPVASIIKK